MPADGRDAFSGPTGHFTIQIGLGHNTLPFMLGWLLRGAQCHLG